MAAAWLRVAGLGSCGWDGCLLSGYAELPIYSVQ